MSSQSTPATSSDAVFSKLKDVSREKGLRLTHQRLEILRYLVKTNDHPSAETVFEHVSKKLPMLSLDTVYRTLATLDELGLIRCVPATGNQARFDAHTHPHHHFICSACKSIHDFFWDEFDHLDLPQESQIQGQAQDCQVVVRGICQACQAKKFNKQ